MPDEIEYPSNYRDLSTDKGFQFEFHCARCRNGHRTRFNPWIASTATSILEMAGSLFGGAFRDAANIGNRMRSAAWRNARDEAFKQAIAEVLPDFVQCPRCQSWVCRDQCWNDSQGLCKRCGPDMGVVASAVQSQKAVQDIRQQAQSADQDKVPADTWKDKVRATCPQCGKALPGVVKFCPECGTVIQPVKKVCGQCGMDLLPQAKFCPDCGKKVDPTP